MASRFTALPLSSGEAFLLETTHEEEKRTILVDSGQRYQGNPHPLVFEIERAVRGLQRIDIAICTHQDADHSNGFRTFADVWCQSGRTIGEFWLPGRWAAAVPWILIDPFEILSRLWNGALSTAHGWRNEHRENPDQLGSIQITRWHTERRLRNLAPMQSISACFIEVGHRDEQPLGLPFLEDEDERAAKLARSLGIDRAQLDGLRRLLEEVDPPAHDVFEVISPFGAPYHPIWWTGDEALWLRTATLFQGAIDTAKTIAAIAEGAVRWTIPIRWFDFGLFEQDQTARGGIEGFLEPVCAVELRRPPSAVSDEVLFYCLSLSRQNVESLVFLRRETDGEPGVLFVGDSRLCFGIDKPVADFPIRLQAPKRQLLVTAPHHGSRVNDEAYRIVEDWLGAVAQKPIYVRNGGHWKQTVDGFRRQAYRRCAQCRLCTTGKLRRRIVVNSKRGDWTLSRRDAPQCR